MNIKTLFFSLMIYVTTFAGGLSSEKIESLRNLLFYSTMRESALDSLDTYISKIEIENVKSENPLLLAYKGAANSIRAKYNFWPWNKLQNVNSGLDMLNRAVKKDKENLEIRFLRFAVLHNLPSILGYSDEADSEAATIYQMLYNNNFNYDPKLLNNVVEFLIRSERLNATQLKMLKNKFGIT